MRTVDAPPTIPGYMLHVVDAPFYGRKEAVCAECTTHGRREAVCAEE